MLLLSIRSNAAPWWMWPNLLSLDAPLVALLWQALLAQTMHIQMGWKEPAILFLAVWTIYLADRTLDSYRERKAGWEPDRKQFYRAHRRLMTAGTATLGLMCGVLALAWLPSATLLCSGLVVGLAVAGYFAILHGACRGEMCSRWPRELVVGIIFALGTFGPVALCCGPRSETTSCSLIFSLLCWVNCSLIETREWNGNRDTRRPGMLAGLAAARAEHVLLGTIALALVLMGAGYIPPLFTFAVVAAAVALAILKRRRTNVSARFFRVAADGALCSPLVILLAQRMA